MKNYLLLIVTVCLFSCNTKQHDENTATIQDETIDSQPTKIIEVGSESNIPGTFDITSDLNAENQIIEGINFGISESQYKKIEKKVLSNYEDEDVYGYHIGDFGFHHLIPYYHNNKLYRIDIQGFNKLNYDDIIKEADIVKNIFSNKYGQPIYVGPIPKDRELNDNQGRVIAEWKAGNKTIQLCFFDFTKAAHSNFLEIVIFRSDVNKEIDNQNKEKQERYSQTNTDKI